MKKRELNFIITALMVFVPIWAIVRTLFEAAQGVGDAPNDFNPNITAVIPALIAVCVYAIVYYGINLVLYAIRKKNKEN